MKVLLINGSPHAHGCTRTALDIVAEELERNGIDTEVVHVGHKDIRGCIGCYKCRELGRCVFDNDLVNGRSSESHQARLDGAIRISSLFILFSHASNDTSLTVGIDGFGSVDRCAVQYIGRRTEFLDETL